MAAFGSLQDFKDSIGSAEDLGPAMFDQEDVHRIGILDIRLLNLDRHLGDGQWRGFRLRLIGDVQMV